MKRRTLIFVFLFFLLTNVNAKKISGYFISNTHDTVRVLFNIPVKFLMQEPNFVNLQKKVKYFDSKNIKQVLYPDMALEVVFDFEGQKYRMLSRNDDLGLNSMFSSDNRIFLNLIKDGKLKLFEYHYSGTAGAPMMGAGGGAPMMAGGSPGGSNYILQKGEGSLFEISVSLFNSFKKQASEYFADCPEVLKKIQDKAYRKDDMELIVDDYNRNCK